MLKNILAMHLTYDPELTLGVRKHDFLFSSEEGSQCEIHINTGTFISLNRYHTSPFSKISDE